MAFDATAGGASPEVELLICCARTHIDSKTGDRMKALLGRDLDWTRLLNLAARHGLRPLLFYHLKAHSPESVPADSFIQLKDHFQNNIKRNLFLTAELLRLLKLFEANGVRAIPYKGPALASFVYGDLALREFVDLDFLVRREQAVRARDLMVSQGYRPDFHLTDAQEAAFILYHCEHLFVHNETNAIVEIQWALAPRFFSLPIDYDRLWERLEPVSFNSNQVMTLSAEDLLLVLCVHGSKHLWERLEWICGVAELIRAKKEIEWAEVMKRSAQVRASRMLLLGLVLASDLLDADIPEEVLQAADADPAVRALALRVRERLFRGGGDYPTEFESSLFHVKSRENLADKLRYWFLILATPTVGDWQLLRLPRSFTFLYYPVRGARLVCKYVPVLLRSLWSK